MQTEEGTKKPNKRVAVEARIAQGTPGGGGEQGNAKAQKEERQVPMKKTSEERSRTNKTGTHEREERKKE